MKDRVIFILGKRGSGKSTLAKRVLSRYSRVMIFDPLSEYREGVIISTIEALFTFAEQPPSEFTIILRFQDVDAAYNELCYDYAARIAYTVGNMLVVLEEAEMFIDSSNVSSYINHLISFGRHKNVSLLAIGRRPREIPIKFRANFTSIAVFKSTEPNDLKHLSDYGFDVEDILNLQEFEYALLGEPLE